jgi:hypothetical protein
MRHHRVQHGCGVGQTGRFEENAAKIAATVVEIAQQCFECVDEVTAHRAAKTARLQQHHVVADVLDEQMVEAYLAKLVDDDRSVRKRRILSEVD